MSQGGAKVNVWLASYPKSGNTWMRLALTSLRQGGAAVAINELRTGEGPLLAVRARFDEALDVDSADLTLEEVMRLRPSYYGQLRAGPGKLHIWKIHDRWERTADGEALFPAEVTAAAIYLVRDPRDIAVSLSHHAGCSVDHAIDRMSKVHHAVSAKRYLATRHLPHVFSSWSDHVESWLDRSDLNPLAIRYEDMVADFGGVLTKVAEVLGWPHDGPAVAGAVAATRFERLREQEEREGFIEGTRPGTAFFRRGIVGSWRDTLTVAQVQQIEHDHRAVMTRLGYL